MRAPLQSKKDIHKIEPFSLKMGPPNAYIQKMFISHRSLKMKVYCIPIIETKTGDVFRLSASGNEIETVSTDPRLVPSHSVGIRAEGSINFMR